MYKQILNEYREKYLSTPRTLADLARAASRAHLAFSPAALALLRALANEPKALKIGVIGQFSSGKSTLLNLFLPEPVLATGARPTSVIAVFIKQGDFKVLARRGGEIYEASGAQNDQNSAAAMPDELHVFSPDERLANIELIDTPGLNANDSDEQFTRALFERFDAAIWLSHAAAPAKASERAAIAQLPCTRRICLLTQADLLAPEQARQALAYAREGFAQHFSEVVLFSAKRAAAGEEGSGMAELVGFLRSLDGSARREKIARILGQISADVSAAAANSQANLAALSEHLAEFAASANEFANSDELGVLADEILQNIRQSAQKIAALLSALLREKPASRYEPARGLWAKNRFERREYAYKTLRPGDAAAEIFYHNEEFSRELKRLQNAMRQRLEALAGRAHAMVGGLAERVAHERTRVLGSALPSVLRPEFAAPSRQFFEAASERVLAPFERAAGAYERKISALLARLLAKALGNFEAAVALTAAHFYEKINVSREFYEQNSAEFKLFVPGARDIERRLLGDLCYYEFEETLVNKGVLRAYARDFAAEVAAGCELLGGQIRAAGELQAAREEEALRMFAAVEY